MFIRSSTLLLLAAIGLGMLARPAGAQSTAPVYDAANGHWYQAVRVAGAISWDDARAAAASLSYGGLPGHLVTVTSAAESQFVAGSVLSPAPNTDRLWLGGYQDGSAADYLEPAGGWRWVTGEPWSYTNWYPGQPDNYGGNEDAIEFHQGPTWNDYPRSTGVNGYVVEYEPTPISTGPLLSFTPNPVPGGQPATGQLLLAQPAGLGGVVVSLSSSNPAAAAVPVSLTVPTGANTFSFPVITFAVGATTPVIITAVSAAGTATGTLQVAPAPAPPSPPASGSPVYNPANGHWYQLIRTPAQINWPDARSAAQALAYAGYPGHLATITSADEAQFINNNVTGKSGLESVWLGGYQDSAAPDYHEPDGGWRWVTGEPWNYTNWHPGEPNDSPHDSNALELAVIWGGQWDDRLGQQAYIAGYVVEFELAPVVTPPPGQPAGGQPVYNPANGHWYQEVRVANKITWPEARAAAQAMSFAGLPGHLVTITSGDENIFVATRVMSQTQPAFNYWTGGYQDRNAPDYREPDRGWRWVTGEGWSYTNWLPGEPNNGAGNNEDILIVAPGGGWNDLYAGILLDAYLVEFEPATTVTPSPTPGSTQLVLFPNPTIGGQPALGQLVLSQPAGPGGLVATLSSGNPAAVVPSAVNIPAGASSATFVIITLPVSAPTPVTITAGCSFGSATAVLQVLPVATQPAVTFRLLVSSHDSGSVDQFDGQTGAFAQTFVPPGGGGLQCPHGLGLGPDGNLYVSSRCTHSILRYDGQTGAFLGVFVPPGSGGLDTPIGLTFGPDSNLYVSSYGTNSVLRYDGRTGAFLGAFVAPNSGGLKQPYGLRFGPDGRLYVCSEGADSVLRYDGQTGAFLNALVPSGSGGLSAAHGLEFGPDGNLYVSSWRSGNILRYDGRTGAFLSVFVPAGSGGLSAPFGIAFGPDGNLYVANFGTNSVLRYDGRTGAFLGTFAAGNGLNGPTWLIFVPASSPVSPVAPNLLVNGSFEQPVVLGNGFRTVGAGGLPGWQILRGTVDVVSGESWQAAPDGGRQSIDLVGNPGAATIEQTFSTVPGQEYLFFGWISHNPDNPVAPEGRADVYLNGAFFVQLFHHDAQTTHQDMRWVPFSYRFRATSPTTGLRLVDVTNLWDAGGGAVLDGLSVTPVADSMPPVVNPAGGLAAPANLTATMAIEARVRLAWTDPPAPRVPGAGENGFVLWRKGGGSDWTKLTTLPANSTSFTDAGVSPSTLYTYRVQATSAAATADFSNEASLTTPAAPAAPFGLTATATGVGQISLAWSVNPSNSTAVEVYRQAAGGDWKLIAALAPGSTRYLDRGLTPGSGYVYRLRAANDYFASGWSNPVSLAAGGGV